MRARDKWNLRARYVGRYAKLPGRAAFYYTLEVMGIQGLMKLVGDYSPSSVKDHEIKNYFGEFVHCLGQRSLSQSHRVCVYIYMPKLSINHHHTQMLYHIYYTSLHIIGMDIILGEQVWFVRVTDGGSEGHFVFP